MVKKQRVLWVDDDGKDRFQYELSVLGDHDLAADWALDAKEAVARLSTVSYELVLLDQVFPIAYGASYRDVWSGCRLLYWLRGQEPPGGAPQGAMWVELLRGNRPLPKNRNIPVIIISGFQDDHVDDALRKVNQGISIFPKPVDGDDIISAINKLLPRSK